MPVHLDDLALGLFPRLTPVRVLSLIHQEDAPTGTFADAVQARGAELTEWNISSGPPPEPPESYDAVFLFGGAMHVDQEGKHPWLRDEDDLIKSLLASEVPLFGVCLGSQLIAKAAGAHVGPAPREEVGWHEVELTPEAADDPVALKDIVQEMRFDPVSARYADFGPFLTGLVLPPPEVCARVGLRSDGSR